MRLSAFVCIDQLFSSHLLIQIVHFHESNSGHVVYTTQNRGVVTHWQLCDDRRFPSVTRRVAAVHDLPDLVGGDNSADYRMCPVIIGGNQSSSAIVQLHGRIKQRIGNAILGELRTNGRIMILFG